MRGLFQILILIFVNVSITSSCSSERGHEDDLINNDRGLKLSDPPKSYELINEEQEYKLFDRRSYKDISYSVLVISAQDFLKEKNIKPSKDDENDISKEAVVILELSSLSGKKLTKNKQLDLSHDQMMTYYSGNVSQHIRCIQNDSIHQVSGVQLDGSMRIDNKIKLLVFGLKIDLNSPFQIDFFDAAFGAGKITFQFNKDNSLA